MKKTNLWIKLGLLVMLGIMLFLLVVCSKAAEYEPEQLRAYNAGQEKRSAGVTSVSLDSKNAVLDNTARVFISRNEEYTTLSEEEMQELEKLLEEHPEYFMPEKLEEQTEELTKESTEEPETLPEEGSIPIDETHFPDEVFRNYVITNFDSDKDGILSIEERHGVSRINLKDSRVGSLQGIEFFPSLIYLWCGGNQLTSLNVRYNTELTVLSCGSNQLTSLDVSNNRGLWRLYCDVNQLTSLDVSDNPALDWLDCNNNQLTSLDVSHNLALRTLHCESNKLSFLDVSNNPSLISIDCYENRIAALDLSYYQSLDHYYITGQVINLVGISSMEYDMKELSQDLDLNRIQRVTGGTVDENGILHRTSPTVKYVYDTGNGRNMEVELNFAQ